MPKGNGDPWLLRPASHRVLECRERGECRKAMETRRASFFLICCHNVGNAVNAERQWRLSASGVVSAREPRRERGECRKAMETPRLGHRPQAGKRLVGNAVNAERQWRRRHAELFPPTNHKGRERGECRKAMETLGPYGT